MNTQCLTGFACGTVVQPRTVLRPTPAPRVSTAALPDSPIKLDKPQRLWEAGSELWFHGYQPPEYLDGSLPGDAGFDPFNLVNVQAGSEALTGVAENPEKNLLWLAEGELYNGRVAMLAVVGILLQEQVFGLAPWWTLPAKADLAPLITDPTAKYLAVVAVGHLFYYQFEMFRVRNFKETGACTNFDPLGFRNDYSRQSEVRNGRLAMLAIAGFAAQAVFTGKTPIQNLKDHIADPLHNNILTQGLPAWYLEGAFLVFSVVINVIGLAKSRDDARVRTYFTEGNA